MALTLRELSDLVNGKVVGNGEITVMGINSLDDASEGEIAFFTHRRFKDRVTETRASALVTSELVEGYRGSQLIVSDPKLAHAKVARLFAPALSRFHGISPQAMIAETSTLGTNASIYPMVWIGEHVVIGEDATIFPGVFIGDGVKVGDRTVIHPNVTIHHDCILGNDVTINAGSVIGSDGFGFVKDGTTNVRIPQLGIVVIDDQVEIGANNSIDRATFGKTWLKRGVKTDNLVQIGHNVVIGEDSIIVALAGISGSVEIGRTAIIGGKVGIADHLKIGDRAMVGSASLVYQSVKSGEIVSGIPAMPHRQWLKAMNVITKLPELYNRLTSLEKKVNTLGGAGDEQR